jgi:biotin transport system substrate-specific component
MSQTIAVSLERPIWKDATLVIGASLVLGLLGQVMIPLPFTPIPLAVRSLLVLLCGAFLGPKRGALAVMGFLAQGVCGMPVFTLGAAGMAALVGPNGGYLVGYVAMAIVTGSLMKKSPFLALSLGTLTLWAFGAGYLASFVGLKAAFFQGVLPFVVGDGLKVLAGWNIVRLMKCSKFSF